MRARAHGIERLDSNNKQKFELPSWLAKMKNETVLCIFEKSISIRFDELEECNFLGSGQFGTVKKMRHKPTDLTFAVKMISDGVTESNNQITDLDIHIKLGNDCPYLIKYYGALHANSYVWILTELMSTSLEIFYKRAFELSLILPEYLLSKISFAVLNAFEYMNTKEILHRDIKPSNILLNLNGEIKLCDFGISGFTKNAICTSYRGCQSYMSPEKITEYQNGYSIKSDIWSLGISLVEMAHGKHPFDDVTVLGLINNFKFKPPPQLDASLFTQEFCLFVKYCLYKNPEDRFSIEQLLNEKFIIMYQNATVDLEFIANVINNIEPKSNV